VKLSIAGVGLGNHNRMLDPIHQPCRIFYMMQTIPAKLVCMRARWNWIH